jgi:hypothetical protein
MMRLRRASVIAALFLLGLATTAYAGDSSGWLAQDTVASRQRCVEKITRIKKQFDGDRLSTLYMLGTQSEVSETRVSYRMMTTSSSWDHAWCLPDTVDPHAPKGK